MRHAPHLSFAGHGARAEAVVLLLHGGTPDSFASVHACDPSVLRLVPFGRSVSRAGGKRIAVASLRYAVRGWNGGAESPLADARWALDQIAERFGHLPVGLVGHSMGGRVALRVADHESVGEGTGRGSGMRGGAVRGDVVRGGEVSSGAMAGGALAGGAVRSVAALAPWLPNGEPIPVLGDRSLLLAHGTADHTTDPAKTIRLAERLSADGGDVKLVTYPGARHAMMFPARPWHTMVAGFMVRTLLGPAAEGPAGRNR